MILLITLAKTGADEFTPRDELSRHPRTTTIFLLKVSSKPFQTSSPSKVMYITKNLFYSSKSHPYLPPPKLLKTSIQETRTCWEPEMSKYSRREEFSIFCQLATSTFNHFQDFQHSERHLIEQRRQKPSSLILAPNATSRKLQGHRMTGFHIASRTPGTQKLSDPV